MLRIFLAQLEPEKFHATKAFFTTRKSCVRQEIEELGCLEQIWNKPGVDAIYGDNPRYDGLFDAPGAYRVSPTGAAEYSRRGFGL